MPAFSQNRQVLRKDSDYADRVALGAGSQFPKAPEGRRTSRRCRALASAAQFLAVCSLVLAVTTEPKAASAASLARLKYNNPGLVVDLGVGLWAWPLPMDFDGDGDLDLLVNCPDKPYNGVYFFENATGDTAKNKMPVFKPGRRISAGVQNVQVSFVDGKPRVL